MNIVLLGMLSVLMLFPMSAAYGSEWNYLMPWNDVDSINVVIESDFDVDDSTIDVVKSVIDSTHNKIISSMDGIVLYPLSLSKLVQTFHNYLL